MPFKKWLIIVGLVSAGACVLGTECLLVQPFEDIEQAIDGDDDDD
jgi:hypothetical protein